MPSLIGVLGLNAMPFQRELQKAQGVAARGGRNLGSALGEGITGALSGFAGLAAIKNVADYAIKTGEAAHQANLAGSKMGITGEEYSQLVAQAEKFGATGSDIETAFRNIARGAVDAMNGNRDLIASFATLGVSTKDLESKSVSQLFDQIARSMAGGELSTQRMAAALKTMGRSADSMLPALKGGAFSVSNPFIDSQADFDVNQQFRKDRDDIKQAAAKLWDELMSPAANQDGLIGRAIRGLAKTTRKYFGIETPSLGKPIDLKAVTRGELESEKKAAEVQKKDLQEIAKLEDELFNVQRKNALERMSTEEKILELKRREAEIEGLMGAGMSAAGRLQAQIDLENLRAQRQGLQDKDRPRMQLQVNELQRIGAFANNPEMDAIQKRQERHLAKLVTLTERLSRPAAGGGVAY